MPQYQNEYGQGVAGLFEYEDGLNGGVNDGSIVSFGERLEGQLVKQFDSPSTDVNGNIVRGGDIIARNGAPISPTPFLARPDNVKNFFETGITSQNNLAISGTNDAGYFRLSYSKLYNKGILPNTDLHRDGLSFSSGYKLTQKLRTRFFVNYLHSGSNNRPGTGYGSENPMYLFTWMGRQVNVDGLKDYWQAGQEGIRQYNYNYLWMDNPYLTLLENTNSFDKNRLLGNLSISYDFSDRLSLTLRSGMDQHNNLRESRRAFSTQRFPNGAYREDQTSFREINTDVLLKYELPIDHDWRFSLSAGANRMDQRSSYSSFTAGELSVPGVYAFENSRRPLVSQQEKYRKRINSVYGLGQFSYKSHIFLDLTARNDWSSTLPAENNSYAYFSASMSFILNRIFDFKESGIFAKLRLSAATVGNDTDPFNLINTFKFQGPYGNFPHRHQFRSPSKQQFPS